VIRAQAGRAQVSLRMILFSMLPPGPFESPDDIGRLPFMVATSGSHLLAPEESRADTETGSLVSASSGVRVPVNHPATHVSSPPETGC
jgi:hypothetical protein